MAKVSIIIPSRDEKYLSKTVDDLFAKAAGEIEIIVALDGPTQYPLPPKRPGLTLINKPAPEGLRPALRDASHRATGKYLLKVDAHSMLSEGYDEILKKDCEDNWVVASRFCTLDPEAWEQVPIGEYDYFYLSCPWTTPRGFLFRDGTWKSKDRARKGVEIDENMTFQGSMWFMTKNHFHNRLHDLCDDIGEWGTWVAEQQEIGIKTWLGGGKVMVNKNVKNAHYAKPITERCRQIPEYRRGEDVLMHKKLALYFLNNRWKGRIHDFDWLIERFWPLPLKNNRVFGERFYWPENWRDYYEKELSK